MEKSHYRGMAAYLLLAALLANTAGAYQQPLVNLGFTSFVDGGPPAGPGFYFAEYVMYWTASDLPGIDAPGDELEVWGSLNQLLYQSDNPLLFGGKWGLDVILPVASFDSEPMNNNDGLGDLQIGPYLQWDPIMGENGPIFMHRVELQMIFPTGDYDEDRALNPGSNFFSFDPYWAGTYFFAPRWSASWRLHYLWNDENDDTNTQPGQAVHANFACSYEAIPKQLRVGVNGYFLEQVTDTERNNRDTGDDESVLAVGPGALYSFSQDTHLFFNVYFETSAEDRPEGEKIILRFVHHF